MTRLQKENGVGRVLRSAVGCALCACGAVIGDAVFLLIGGSASREWPGTLMLALSALVAFFAVRRLRLISSQMIEEKEAGK